MEAVRDWLGRAERALDEFGKPAWIATMVVGFILFVPIGLAILAYMIWSGRMGCSSNRRGWGRRMKATAPTGNAAFDAYREETLRRLETEREAFTSFLERLRKAKDQAEFEQFMSEQRSGAARPEPQAGPAPATDRSSGGGGFGGAEPYPA